MFVYLKEMNRNKTTAVTLFIHVSVQTFCQFCLTYDLSKTNLSILKFLYLI